jgi:hypothetical protein
MLTVFCNIERDHDWAPMWFDLNGGAYQIWNSNSRDLPDHVDIEVRSPTPDPKISMPSRRTVDLCIWDNYENQMWSLLNERCQDDIIVTNVQDRSLGGNHIVFDDFLFNRTKAYYEGYTFPSGRRWYWVNSRAYELSDIVDADCKTHVYLAPNKSYATSDWRQIRYRPRLVDHLMENHRDRGYIGDYHRLPDLVLYPHYLAPDCDQIQDLISGQAITQNIRGALKGNLWGYSPPHNLYYQDTFVSVYSETIEHGTTHAITEKTFDPMIKGHFVLPFANAGFIEFVKQQGWQLPDFIDYSYDQEINNDRRFAKYLAEVDRLCALDLDTWRQHWQDNLALLRSNRQRFFDQDYHRIDLTEFL